MHCQQVSAIQYVVQTLLSTEGEGVGGGGHSSLLDDSLRGRTQQKRQLNLDWQHLFWMLTSFATLYLTNFASHLLFNDSINR